MVCVSHSWKKRVVCTGPKRLSDYLYICQTHVCLSICLPHWKKLVHSTIGTFCRFLHKFCYYYSVYWYQSFKSISKKLKLRFTNQDVPEEEAAQAIQLITEVLLTTQLFVSLYIMRDHLAWFINSNCSFNSFHLSARTQLSGSSDKRLIRSKKIIINEW